MLTLGGQLEVDLFGVAAAQVEVVPVEELLRLIEGFPDQLVPALLAVAVEAAAADVVLVGFLLPGVVAEFEAGAKPAAGEERTSPFRCPA